MLVTTRGKLVREVVSVVLGSDVKDDSVALLPVETVLLILSTAVVESAIVVVAIVVAVVVVEVLVMVGTIFVIAERVVFVVDGVRSVVFNGDVVAKVQISVLVIVNWVTIISTHLLTT